MNNIMLIKSLRNIFNRETPKSKLDLSNFSVNRVMQNDDWNHVLNSQVLLRYHDQKNKHIATISYRLQSGQIGLLFVHDDKLKGCGLGKQMLKNAIDEIKNKNQINPNVKEIWAVTNNDAFFSNVFGKSFTKREPAHPSVTGSGYFMSIDKAID